VNAAASPDAFRDLLADHAAGFLAPLIQTLKVDYPSDLLRSGVALVDLPGVGVAGDVYRTVTVEWVRKKARAVVLVVDRSGVTEAVADLLRSSEFFARLLYANDNPNADPVALFVAVTRVDDVAAENRRNDKTRSKREHFEELGGRLKVQLVGQITDHLEAVLRQGDRELSGVEREVVGRVVAGLRVHPLSEVEYRKLLLDDEDEPAFVKGVAGTGLPGLADDLRALATSRRLAWEEALRARQAGLEGRVRATLRAAVPAAEEAVAALAEEATRLRESFRGLVADERREYDVRLGQFREFWRVTLRERIRAEVFAARLAAGPRIRAYLGRLADAHAATLQAAVNRGGAFTGARRIDRSRPVK
jgi:hypothetical protein